MQRITVTVDDALSDQFAEFMARHGYDNRSEAFRDLLRDRIERERFEQAAAPDCVGCLTYVYRHAERELSRRLVKAQHEHHDLSLSTLHLHLDHENCLEVVVLRGPTEQVSAFASAMIAQPGVRHGHLWQVPVALETDAHRHGHPAESAHPHVHSRPAT